MFRDLLDIVAERKVEVLFVAVLVAALVCVVFAALVVLVFVGGMKLAKMKQVLKKELKDVVERRPAAATSA